MMKKLFVISGRPCSGKTSMTYKLSLAFNIHAEYLDVLAAKVVDSSKQETPELYRWKDWDLVSILSKEPDILFQKYLVFYGELLPFVIEFIKDHLEDSLILESAFFLPKHIKALAKEFEVTAIFMKTSDAFVRQHYVKRDYVMEMIKQEKGRKSVENLLLRDALYASYV